MRTSRSGRSYLKSFLIHPPRSRVELGNALAEGNSAAHGGGGGGWDGAAATGDAQLARRHPLHAKQSLARKCGPKYNLGPRSDDERSAQRTTVHLPGVRREDSRRAYAG